METGEEALEQEESEMEQLELDGEGVQTGWRRAHSEAWPDELPLHS